MMKQNHNFFYKSFSQKTKTIENFFSCRKNGIILRVPYLLILGILSHLILSKYNQPVLRKRVIQFLRFFWIIKTWFFLLKFIFLINQQKIRFKFIIIIKYNNKSLLRYMKNWFSISRSPKTKHIILFVFDFNTYSINCVKHSIMSVC